jgi:hypothetical protein
VQLYGQVAKASAKAAEPVVRGATVAVPPDGVKQAASEFQKQLRDGREDVQRQAIQTGREHAAFRIILIVLASIVAFGKNFSDTHFKFMVKWVPLLSLIVAIGTGVDTFLKLGERATGNYNYVSNVEDLELRTNRVVMRGQMTEKELQDFEDRYSTIKEQHRRELTY